jgi:hypothetical protein
MRPRQGQAVALPLLLLLLLHQPMCDRAQAQSVGWRQAAWRRRALTLRRLSGLTRLCPADR